MINYTLATLTPPSAEPVTLAEAKKWLRAGDIGTEDDDEITSLITAAREYLEDVTRRQFMPAKFQMGIDVFPYGTAELQFLWNRFGILKIPKPPLRSIEQITYVQFGGAVAVHSPSLYQVDIASEPGRVAPAFTQVWPIAQYTTFNAVKVDFNAGYLDADHVPARLKVAIKMMVDTCYNNRGTSAEQAANELPGHFRSFIRSLNTGEYE